MELHQSKFHQKRYESRFLGMYHFLTPVLTIRDPELIQQMLVKDMDCFAARHSFVPRGLDPFWDANIFALEQAKWRQMRSKLSPVFTGAKIKSMIPFMTETALIYVDYLTKNNVAEFCTKDLFKRLGTDIFTNTFLGVPSNSQPNLTNEFFESGLKLSNFNGFLRSLTINLTQSCPSLSKLLGIKSFDPEASDFFLKIVKEQIKDRKAPGFERKDMLDLLLDEKDFEETTLQNAEETKNINEQSIGFASTKELPPPEVENDILDYQNLKKLTLTDLDVTSQVLFFFISCHDTVSTALSFLCYELSRHHTIQTQLKQEIDEVLTRVGSVQNITYEDLCGMEYLDQIVSESLRKWPPAVFTDRKAVSSYNIPRTLDSMQHYPYESDVLLQPGDVVVIPIYAIHRCPQNFPNPKVFDPSRFDKVNQKNIKPYTYMPFGVGGKNCLGSQFALLQIKITVFCLVAKFRLHLTKRTSLNLAKGLFNLDSNDGIWLGLEERK